MKLAQNKDENKTNGETAVRGSADTKKANQAAFGSGLLLDASRWLHYPGLTVRQKKRESGGIKKEGEGHTFVDEAKTR